MAVIAKTNRPLYRAYLLKVPSVDAPMAAKIREARMIVLGKTNTPEFGMLPVTESALNGICHNPWDPQLTAGGSSGGAAASVAAGITALAHGTDGAGSLRIPAACCGVFAVVPGPGALPAVQRPTLAGMPREGVISRTVGDAVLFLQAMKALGPGEVVRSPATHRFEGMKVIAASSPPIECTVDPGCVAAMWGVADVLSNAGCEVVDATPDWYSDRILNDMMILRSSIPVGYGDPDESLLDRTTLMTLTIAKGTSMAEMHRALVRSHTYASRAVSILGEDSVLMTPTTARTRLPHGWVTEPDNPEELFKRAAAFAPFTALANLAGLCAVSLPIRSASDEHPVGVQLMAKPAMFPGILRLAATVEQHGSWCFGVANSDRSHS